MKKILAAIDFSDITTKVIETASTLTKKLDGELCILHTEPSQKEFDEYKEAPQSLRDIIAKDIKDDMKHLHIIKDVLKKDGINAKTMLLKGPATETIIMEAKRFEADLIIIGSHEHGDLYHLIFGGVQNSLIKHSPCPVLVVPHEYNPK